MEFRPMRRKERLLRDEEACRILSAGQFGVLSVNGDDGYPYGVPVNYGYVDGKILFHGAANGGYKLQALQRDPKVCFTVVAEHCLAEEEYTAYYASVIVYGRARIITQRQERHRVMERMMSVLSPAYMPTAVENCGSDHYVMVEITPEHITGKSNMRS